MTNSNHRDLHPSRADVALYRALIKAPRPYSVDELVPLCGRKKSTVAHTLVTWARRGLVKQRLLENRAYYQWRPTRAARVAAARLADSASLVAELPQEHPAPAEPKVSGGDPVAHALRALGQILIESAEKLEKEKLVE